MTHWALVTGDREWSDKEGLWGILDLYHPAAIIHGCARGADTIAGKWAVQNRAFELRFPANWELYGKGAGPIRNRMMFDAGNPDTVYAFHDELRYSRGTKDMVEYALSQMCPVKLFAHEPYSVYVRGGHKLTARRIG